MSESNINVTPGSGGPNIDLELIDNGNARQVIVIGDPSASAKIASVDSTLGLSVNPTALPPLAATSTKQSDGSQKSQIVDGSGNVATVNVMATGNSLNVSVNDYFVTGSITTLNGTVTTNLTSAGTVEIFISGTFSASLNLEGTIDGVNWTTLVTATGSSGLYSTSSFSATGRYRTYRTSALTQVRVRATSYTSGTAIVEFNTALPVGISEAVQQTPGNLIGTAWINDGSGNSLSSTGGALNTSDNLAFCGGATLDLGQEVSASSLPVVIASDQSQIQISQTQEASNLCQSSTAATGSGVTVTLPAVVSQFHYITLIEIHKYFTVANAASATPLVVTTTNLPGSLAFTFGQPAGAIGVTDERIYTPPTPLKSSVINTPTTIVCPATTGIIWRVNVFYFTAP